MHGYDTAGSSAPFCMLNPLSCSARDAPDASIRHDFFILFMELSFLFLDQLFSFLLVGLAGLFGVSSLAWTGHLVQLGRQHWLYATGVMWLYGKSLLAHVAAAADKWPCWLIAVQVTSTAITILPVQAPAKVHQLFSRRSTTRHMPRRVLR